MDFSLFKEIEASVDSSVMMKLEQIRRFLREGKASIMVGSGFSKNALMDEEVRMLNWNELSACFYKELFGNDPTEKDLMLKSALRLAQQVESVKGRNALEELIKDSLPNGSISPGYLHKLLVSLNWRDIFTTNYDTLLEDAADFICKHYNIVTSKHSLIYQPHPRIVKLHGSFPDNRPFIITEEDYRTYAKKFPEFVNTVRQALIETQFILIGFSGDDPNFLNWLGWVRDIMGNRMLPVYLISVGSIPHLSEVQLMESRGVQMIHTAAFSDNISEAFDFILSYIGDKNRKNTSWSGTIPIRISQNDLFLVELTKTMKSIRESYPKWLLLPVDKIPEFSDTWEKFPFYGTKFEELTNEEDKIDFLCELTWRLNVSFMPQWIEDNWYVKALEWSESVFDTANSLQKATIIELSLNLLRIYRQRDDKRFIELQQRILQRLKFGTYSSKRKFCYEGVIWHLQHNEIEKSLEKLETWSVSTNDYLGILWKSRLLIEVGQEKKAALLLEQGVNNARRQQLSNSSSNFYSSALCILENCLSVSKHEKPDNSNTKFPPFIEYRDFVLKEMSTENNAGYQRVHGFNIGNSTSSWNSGGIGYVIKYVGAARYFQIAEEYGRPIGLSQGAINSDVVKKALPILASVNLRSTILYIIEANSREALDIAISRRTLMSGISKEYAIKLFEEWLQVVENTIKLKETYYFLKNIEVIIPLLCRLCIHLEADKILKVIKLLIDLQGKTHHNFNNDISTAYNSLPLENSRVLWWQVMRKPVRLDYYENDYCFPGAIINKWEGDCEVVKNIESALVSDNLDVVKAGTERLETVYILLPENSQKEVDSIIETQWKSISKTTLIHYLGLNCKYVDDKPWGKSFKDYLGTTYEKFLSLELTPVSSSEPISSFGELMSLFVNCSKHLDTSQIDKIVEHIIRFIATNHASITNDDSDTFFGGIRHFWMDSLKMVNFLMSSIDITKLNHSIAADIYGQMISLKDEFPFAKAIVSVITSDGNNFSKGKGKERENLRQVISDGIRSGNKTFIRDSFEAAIVCHKNTNGRFGLQGIVDEVVNRIHYLHDEVAVWYLKNLSSWIKAEVVTEAKLKRLVKFLKEMPEAVVANDGMSYEIKADLLYYGGRLVGLLTKYSNEYEYIQECIQSWELMISEEGFPSDIRKGYYIGQELSELDS